jgi:hypothetical protein
VETLGILALLAWVAIMVWLALEAFSERERKDDNGDDDRDRG